MHFPLRFLIRSALFVIPGGLAVVPSALGEVTFFLHFNPASSPQAQQTANSVAAAAAFYNEHGSFNKHWNVYYNAGIPTAEGNVDGYMGYGGVRNERVVFHEAAHTFGMGTTAAYANLISGGVWKGMFGNQAQTDTYNDFGDGLHGDGHAVWPGGFNYDNEDGFIERIWHTRIMAGIRADMGFPAFTREAVNEAVVAGETAVFHVEAPRAVTWRWSRNGTDLNNGGRISGAQSATLMITGATASDAGLYRCTVTGAGETLANRPRRLWVHAAPQLGQWNFDGNASESLGSQHGTAFGGPGWVNGKLGQAVDLDGIDNYIDLPDGVGRFRDVTVSAWVQWDGGNNWQRVFDFGTGTWQYLFLSPKSGSNTLRLAFKDSINGKDVEYQVNAPVLAAGQWIHLTAVLGGPTMTLYVNGKVAGATYDLPGNRGAFPAVNNYIGKSQFQDPFFNGRIEDFRVYGKALSGAEIWNLWGQSANQVPVFSSSVISLPAANALVPFPGGSLAEHASDPDGNLVTFTKLHGPDWLKISSSGVLSGQPGPADTGLNVFYVRAADSSGGGSDAMLEIPVSGPAAAPVTLSATAPLRDADDAFFLPGSLPESSTIGGTTNAAANDELTYSAANRSSKGQSFTTGPHPGGYFLQSFTFQHVQWPSFTSPGTSADIQPEDEWEFQVGTFSGTTRTPLLNYTGTFDGTSLTGSGNSGTGRFLTFNLSGMGSVLPPDTECYFLFAPLNGNPLIELNSAKNSTYAGGTALRGTAAGISGSTTLPLEGAFAFHANLEPRPDTSPSTIAFWNFQEGASNTHVPYARSDPNQYQGSIFDQSGNANHLSVWAANWHWYRSQVPAATTPRTGADNSLSLQNAGNFPAISATGTSLTTWSPVTWTIEAAIRPDDATTSGFQTFIGRDSLGAAAADPSLAAFYFAVTPSGALRVVFTDAAGNNWAVTSVANAIRGAQWHAVAATSNGSTLSLYRKNISAGDANYALLGSVSLASSPNPALSTGMGDGPDWDAGVFSIARGLYNGGHTDRFIGHLDDIRFSNTALAPADFLYSPAPASPDMAWRETWFGTTANSGNASDAADPDQDGLSNLMERALGSNPTVPGENPSLIAAGNPTPGFLTLTYTRASGYGISLTVEESTDAAMAIWTPSTGTETITAAGPPARVEFTVPASTTGRKFLRLKAVAVFPE